MAGLELKQIEIVLHFRSPDEFREASRWLSQHKPDKWPGLSEIFQSQQSISSKAFI